MDDLEKFVSGDYVSFKTTPTIRGIYKQSYVEDDPFAKTKGDKRMVYILEIEGEDKKLTSKSKRLANQMLKLKLQPGELIEIERIGVSFDTDYRVERVDSKKKDTV
jgi:hypothetical protein